MYLKIATLLFIIHIIRKECNGINLDKIQSTSKEYEYPGYDGWYNNLGKPELGAIDQPLLRRTPNSYKDGVYEPNDDDLPNPFEVSDAILADNEWRPSTTGRNAFLVYFGQHVVEEILDAQRPACPPEYFNIKIPENHKKYPHRKVKPFLRTRYDQKTGFSPNNPRQQLNEITPYIDGGLFYGITKQWSDQLRTYANGTLDQNGKLASSHNGLFPEYNNQSLPMANPPPPTNHDIYVKQHETDSVKRFFKLGNPRGNENPFLLSMGIIWFRWHNHLAGHFRKKHQDWSSEKIFNEARKWTIATQQKIIVYDWLPEFVGKNLTTYKYDPSVDPQIDQVFQSAAFRFGHTLVTPGVYLRDYVDKGCGKNFKGWNKSVVRTCNSFWRPNDPILARDEQGDFLNVDRLIMGMTVQLCEKEDSHVVEDLRGNVFGPLEFPRRDLMALNIQRGRDHGLPGYSACRRAFGLGVNKFELKIHNMLLTLYGNDNLYEKIDAWVGGILETTDKGPGEFFSTVIVDQFNRIRNGDRFWFENYEMNKLFKKEEVDLIRNIKIRDIILAVTNITKNDIPHNPFKVPIQNVDIDLINKCNLVHNFSYENKIYHHLPSLKVKDLERCKTGSSDEENIMYYDYFSNSEASFGFTLSFLFSFICGTIGVIFLLKRLQERKLRKMGINLNDAYKKSAIKRHKTSKKSEADVVVSGTVWTDSKTPPRRVVIKISNAKIEVESINGTLMRALEYKKGDDIRLVYVCDQPTLIIQSNNSSDLVLKFETHYMRSQLETKLENFVTKLGLNRQKETKMPFKAVKITTQKDRQKKVEMFFRVVFAQAFNIQHSSKELLKMDSNVARDIINIELTLLEFAESLQMKPSNEFVQKLFEVTDRNKNGFISYREFVDLYIIFAKGDENEKAKLLFKMYDIDNTGQISRDDFRDMIRSYFENCEGREVEKTIQSMVNDAGLDGKTSFNLEDFKKILGEDIKSLNMASLGFPGVKDSHLMKTVKEFESIYIFRNELNRFQNDFSANEEAKASKLVDEEQDAILKSFKPVAMKSPLRKFLEIRSKEIFWTTLYTLVLLGIFIESAYYYAVEKEHTGFRRILWYGMSFTRGAASGMMFTYSSLLATMCRNTITFLKNTPLNQWIPFDSSVTFHKYIARWALFFTVIHIVGHAFNFYHISTQTADDLSCLFRNFHHATHELPKFHYWCWCTITGVTGNLLVLICSIMYAFSLPQIVRQKIYHWFWYTHNLYPVFYILLAIHGAGRLVQAPYLFYYLVAPLTVFTIDTIISVNRKKIEIPVLQAEILPSNVTMLRFKKPYNFQYKAGQWVRIACVNLNKNEFHPFTLSSSPQEQDLTVHIRTVGPWTSNLRNVYQNAMPEAPLPKIYLDGPFGEGYQDWNTYDVSILIGSGIGVTPFASILKDIATSKEIFTCKKVYFIWVCKTQRQFEWMVDTLRQVENSDTKKFISCHIFITEFYEKFDLRTTIMYMCEKHYQKFSSKSLFTGLQAVTHFGRPNFARFFTTVESIHTEVSRYGVFSCSSPSVVTGINNAIREMNKKSRERNVRFEHQCKSF
ncbi:unnamed protein product [Brassicogethes aeneus]|uniref:NAD(P)H oxidase (H2O2-forming) n=1 Tax=Brassicogethes aeneus TaxID=1431903 RepID=A0A9P0FLF0_BRAAE|nr:unnamed protein product [Brassicogethes aeneus]